MMYSLPSLTAEVSIITGLDPGISTSVMEKQLRILPSTRGLRYFSFCSGVPWRWRISILPASGAWHPKTKCPSGDLPSDSETKACSTRLSPMPPNSLGWFGAQSSIFLTMVRFSSMTGSISLKVLRRNSGSSGMSSFSTNSSIIEVTTFIFSGTSKSILSLLSCHKMLPIGDEGRIACEIEMRDGIEPGHGDPFFIIHVTRYRSIHDLPVQPHGVLAGETQDIRKGCGDGSA